MQECEHDFSFDNGDRMRVRNHGGAWEVRYTSARDRTSTQIGRYRSSAEARAEGRYHHLMSA
jgi:hypothetical protein